MWQIGEFVTCFYFHKNAKIKTVQKGDVNKMANRFVLNETSYHGKGAINEITNEAKARGFQKALVCSDPD